MSIPESKHTVLHFKDAELALARELAARMNMPLTHAVKVAVKQELGMKHPEDVSNVSPAIGHLKAALASLERHQMRTPKFHVVSKAAGV